MTLSSHIRGYLADYQKDYDYRHQGIVASFEVDDLALSVGKFYEQVRKVIDWKDENALRRGAIARAIKRNFVAQIYSFETERISGKIKETAESMVFELMRSGYFDNNFINAAKVMEVTKVVYKYIVLLQDLNSGHEGLSKADLKQRIKLQTWTIELAACEIEECLAPPYKTKALIELMQGVLSKRIKVIPASSLSENEREKYLHIAIWRALFEADDYLLSYILIKCYESDFNNYKHFFERRRAAKIFALKSHIDADLTAKVGRQFLRIANRYDAVYRLIGEITQKASVKSVAAGESFFASEEKVKGFFDEIYAEKFRSLKLRLLKMAFWTTLSILIANAASVLILEIPVAQLMGIDFGWWAIMWDILIPSSMMFLLVILIRPPRSENQDLAWKEISKVIYDSGEKDIYEIRNFARTNRTLQAFFTLSTFVAGFCGLWFLGWLFYFAGLPVTSVYLNVVYITMVFFASLTIRQKAQEITIYERTGVFDFILDIFSIPLARIGQWFSKKWKEYNIFSIIFSVLIDAPLSLFIGFIQEWRNFLKESKSELR
jgi:hypothetical protein